MSAYTVTTQAEFDAAWAAHQDDRCAEILIDSPRGVWIEVRAYGSATVTASSYVAVHLHSARVTVSGGVILDVTKLDLTDVNTWADYTGATITDGHVTLYKAVDANLVTGHSYIRTTWAIGDDVTCTDWKDTHTYGYGLHASPHPHQALHYNRGATRMLEVTVPVADLRTIPGSVAKAKARTMRVVREVNLDGSPIEVTR